MIALLLVVAVNASIVNSLMVNNVSTAKIQETNTACLIRPEEESMSLFLETVEIKPLPVNSLPILEFFLLNTMELSVSSPL